MRKNYQLFNRFDKINLDELNALLIQSVLLCLPPEIPDAANPTKKIPQTGRKVAIPPCKLDNCCWGRIVGGTVSGSCTILIGTVVGGTTAANPI